MSRQSRYSPEVRERAVRMVLEHGGDYASRWEAIRSIAAKIGCSGETLRKWVRQSEVDTGLHGGTTSDERARLKELEREVRELRRTNEILRKASAYFAPGGARPPTQVMVSFIDDHRTEYGVEPICRVLPIAPSTYYAFRACEVDPTLRSKRALRDDDLRVGIQRVYDENRQVYGAPKIWRQLLREGIEVARCTVERLMREMGLQGRRRGKRVRTTTADDSGQRPPDLVDRKFEAQRPDQLWVADFTYVSTWCGFVFVAFIIDVFSRRIVGWRMSSSMTSDFVLDALEQAVQARRPGEGLIHHSDQGSQYTSIRYSERLDEAGIKPSVGSVADSYDNALAETINGLFKAEVIWPLGPWKHGERVEFETLKWVEWSNNRRLLSSIGWMPPAEFEEAYWRSQAAEPAELVLT
ncbi:IS3 family transposase [bacterium]|nr:MAG: IS3 family transposase [bacterium]